MASIDDGVQIIDITTPSAPIAVKSKICTAYFHHHLDVVPWVSAIGADGVVMSMI